MKAERAYALRYVGTDGSEFHWDMIRLALGSVADVAIVPMQDLLGLGSEARMNVPGKARELGMEVCGPSSRRALKGTAG